MLIDYIKDKGVDDIYIISTEMQDYDEVDSIYDTRSSVSLEEVDLMRKVTMFAEAAGVRLPDVQFNTAPLAYYRVVEDSLAYHDNYSGSREWREEVLYGYDVPEIVRLPLWKEADDFVAALEESEKAGLPVYMPTDVEPSDTSTFIWMRPQYRGKRSLWVGHFYMPTVFDNDTFSNRHILFAPATGELGMLPALIYYSGVDGSMPDYLLNSITLDDVSCVHSAYIAGDPVPLVKLAAEIITEWRGDAPEDTSFVDDAVARFALAIS